MGLIICPECQGNVSSYAKECPHCGYPIATSKLAWNIIEFNGKSIDVKIPLETMKINGIESVEAECAVVDVCMELGLPDDYMEPLLKIVMSRYSEVENIIPDGQSKQDPVGQPKCPTCGSTNVERINLSTRVAATVLFGVVSNTARSQFRCRACGYKW